MALACNASFSARNLVSRTASLATRLWLAAGLTLAGCAPGANLVPLTPAPISGYTLGSGDIVHITTFGDTDLTGDFHVSDAGQIALPLGGNLPAAGKTTTQLAEAITQRLQDQKILNDPHVAVEISAYRPVFVLGEVKNPGSYPYQPGMTLLMAVAVAGGYTYRAWTSYAEVVRTTGGMPVDAKALPDSAISPGDVINIYERNY